MMNGCEQGMKIFITDSKIIFTEVTDDAVESTCWDRSLDAYATNERLKRTY